jgi:CBS domain-containing protein
LKTAQEIMSPHPITVGPETKVKEMAQIMVDNRISCLPVVDEEGKLLGVVDEEDLVHPETKVHFPTTIHFLDSYLFLPSSLKEFEKEIHQAVGSKASDRMNDSPYTVGPQDRVEDVASLMVDKELESVMVVEDDKLQGVITQSDLLKNLAGG